MEKTAVIVPGEKKEPPGPYSIGFENILVAKARVGWWKLMPFQHASRRLLALQRGKSDRARRFVLFSFRTCETCSGGERQKCHLVLTLAST